MTNYTQSPSIYDLSATERDLEKWWRDLNCIVGPLALTMAIGCKSLTFWPGLIFSLLGCLVMFSILKGIRPRFTCRIKQLRELAKTDQKAAEALQFAEKHFLSHWCYFSFLAGFMSLGLIAGWYVIGGLYAANPHIFPWLVPYLPTLP